MFEFPPQIYLICFLFVKINKYTTISDFLAIIADFHVFRMYFITSKGIRIFECGD